MPRGTLVAAALVFAVGSCGSRTSQPTMNGKDPVVTVSASTVGRFAKGSSWHLEASSTDGATLTVGEETIAIAVSEDQFDELRRIVEEEGFFGLDAQYGELVPDGSERTIKVSVGSKTNAVTLRFLMNWVRSDPGKLKEPARAVRVLRTVRTWFDHPDAVDLGRYDQMVLDAVR